MKTNSEQTRIQESEDDITGWPRWRPYVSDRSWATVRQDYSADGEAWTYFPHDLARSKAYRWGEDGIAGLCDRYQLLVFAPAFWNERDPILKERFFGLTSIEGNHGADVKEYYFFLDNTPTHSYMRMRYKYPQADVPYQRLVEENARRGGGLEFELLDTGIFDEDRYFDIFVEYAKNGPEDICVRIEAFNRGPDPAPLHVIPQLWFRNTWGWGQDGHTEPSIALEPPRTRGGAVALLADDRRADRPPNLTFAYQLGERRLYGSPV